MLFNHPLVVIVWFIMTVGICPMTSDMINEITMKFFITFPRHIEHYKYLVSVDQASFHWGHSLDAHVCSWTMSSSEMYDWNETVNDQELLQIPTEMFEWDEVKSDQELPTKVFEWNEEVSDEELMKMSKEMTEWNEVVGDKELMNIPLDFFVPNDCGSLEMDLGDSELIQGFLHCDSWDWDETMFDYEGNLFQIFSQ